MQSVEPEAIPNTQPTVVGDEVTNDFIHYCRESLPVYKVVNSLGGSRISEWGRLA